MKQQRQKLSLSASIYVDNQEEIGFPISWIIPRLPSEVQKIYLFASDDSNLRAALRGIKDPRVVQEPIGIGIRIPTDIARAQNECLRRVDRKSYDAHIMIQADIWLLPVAFERLSAMPYSAKAAPHILSVEHVRLHAQTFKSVFGATVFFPGSKSKKHRFDEGGDGAYPISHHVLGDDQALAMDIGWHSAEAIARHLRVHARTWSSKAHADLAALFDTDRRAFMKGVFQWVRKTTFPDPSPMPLHGPYGQVIESMGLQDEYKEACAVLMEGPDHQPASASKPAQRVTPKASTPTKVSTKVTTKVTTPVPAPPVPAPAPPPAAAPAPPPPPAAAPPPPPAPANPPRGGRVHLKKVGSRWVKK